MVIKLVLFKAVHFEMNVAVVKKKKKKTLSIFNGKKTVEKGVI